MNINSKISVITVAYNSYHTLGDTLKSVAFQTYLNVEHILIDGGSSDDTFSLVCKEGKHLTKYISEPDFGIFDAMNKGLNLATGEIIGFLNSDDFYIENNVLEEVARAFSENPNLDIVMGGIDFVHPSNLLKIVRKVDATGFYPWMMRFGFMPPHPSVFIKRSAYARIGSFNTKYKIGADFDLFVRLFMLDSAKYKAFQKRWVRMRTGGISTSGWSSMKIITQENLDSLMSHQIHSHYFILLLRLPVKFLRQVLLIRLANFLNKYFSHR
jgi:glycosyltransferase involved in cell wall biosynthesis